jgi:ABC-type amino acid transport substrate-binding protein
MGVGLLVLNLFLNVALIHAGPSLGDKSSQRDTGAVQNIAITLGKSQYVTLGVLVGAVASLVASGYALVRYLEIRPLERQRDDLKAQASLAEGSLQELKTTVDELTNRYHALLKANNAPVLIAPAGASDVLGTNVTFEWDYSRHDQIDGYVLELRNLTPTSGSGEDLLNVARPETKQFYLQLRQGSGDYLWRVRPGRVVDGEIAPQGPWSSFSSFRLYATIRERICKTHRIRLATVPSSYDSFARSDGHGQYLGFDIELAHWLVRGLAECLTPEKHLTAEFVETPWDTIFHSLQDGDVDMAIRSLTRSKKREEQYPNVRFTRGYARNHQIFIQTRPGSRFPDDLKRKVVGVKKGSINEAAAQYLASKFEFIVDGVFVNYGELYQALRSGQIRFAMVDSLLAESAGGFGFSRLGPELDAHLDSFYAAELGYDTEEYAVAVHDPPIGDGILATLDEILSSTEAGAYLNSLRAKYGLVEATT